MLCAALNDAVLLWWFCCCTHFHPPPFSPPTPYSLLPTSYIVPAFAHLSHLLTYSCALFSPPHSLSREIYTDDFDELYAALKPKGITISAMLAKAVAEVLKKHQVVNAAYVEGGIKYNKDVNVAMAVAIDGGLITPTIIKANEMDLFSIGRTWKELVDKAKSKKLSPAEYSSGTFTISNLGMFGVQQFDAILPPGTGSILAIAASTPKVVQLKNGHFGVKKSMTVTITCDHRHIYGADAAEFLRDLAGKTMTTNLDELLHSCISVSYPIPPLSLLLWSFPICLRALLLFYPRPSLCQ